MTHYNYGVDTNLHGKLNTDTNNLKADVETNADFIITNTLLYNLQNTPISDNTRFEDLGVQSGTYKKFNTYEYDLINEYPQISSIVSVWVENDKDTNQFYILANEAGNISFIKVTLDYSTGTPSFEKEFTTGNLPGVPVNHFRQAWKGYKASNGDFVIVSVSSDDGDDSIEIAYEAKSYNSDGSVITTGSGVLYSYDSADNNDDVDGFFVNSDTFTSSSATSHRCPIFWRERDEDVSSSNRFTYTLFKIDVVYNTGTQSFSASHNQIDAASDPDSNISIEKIYQKDNTLHVYYSWEEEEAVSGVELRLKYFTVNLSTGATSAVSNLRTQNDDNSSDATVSNGHQDFFAYYIYSQNSDSSTWYRDVDFDLWQDGVSLHRSQGLFNDGWTTHWDDVYYRPEGLVWSIKYEEDIGSSVIQFKKYFNKDGTVTNLNLTPQFNIKPTKYWLVNNSERKGFNISGTTLILNFAASTGREFILPSNTFFRNYPSARSGSALYCGFLNPSYWSSQEAKVYFKDVGTPWNFLTDNLQSFDLEFKVEGMVLDGNTPKIGVLCHGTNPY